MVTWRIASRVGLGSRATYIWVVGPNPLEKKPALVASNVGAAA